MNTISHHTIRESLRKRIESGEWALGDLIPAETALADEYSCARTTINRALRTLAEEGLLIRKRKGGTRVKATPTRYAKLEIPIVREQIEAIGSQYQHRLLSNTLNTPPAAISTRLNISGEQQALYLETLHLADGRPFAYEERWVNVSAVPDIINESFEEISVNEWLVKTVPFSSGDVMFSATNADQQIANALESKVGNAIFLLDRTTWMNDEFITAIKLYYRDGFQLYSKL